MTHPVDLSAIKAKPGASLLYKAHDKRACTTASDLETFCERGPRRCMGLRSARMWHSALCRKPVRWYIMTSAATDQETKAFFRQRSYFGLTESQVVFFQQVSTLSAW